MYNKFDEVSLSLNEHSPNIAVFTESWLDDNTPDSSISIPPYQIVRKDRNSRGGGIVCYVSAQYLFSVLDIEAIHNNYPPCASEILLILFPGEFLLLLCVYHPFWQDNNKNSDCIASLLRLIDYVSTFLVQDQCMLKTIVCGDFNGLRSQFGDFQSVSGLNPIVANPTRGANILDQIFTDIVNFSKPCVLAPIGRSDHSVVLCKPSSSLTNKSAKKRVRIFSKSNKAKFAELMCSYDWLNFVSSFDDVNEAALFFLESIKCLFDVCFPFRIVRVKPNGPPWLSNNLRVLLNERDKAFHKKIPSSTT